MPILHLLILGISIVLILIGTFYIYMQIHIDLACKLLFIAIILLSIQNIWIKYYSCDVAEYSVIVYLQ